MRTFFVLILGVAWSAPALADNVARGRLLLEQNCSRCHAIGKDGDSLHDQAPPFRYVMKIYGADSLSEALGEGLVTGHPDMPEFKFPPEDVGAIVDYLRTLESP
jgi:mono/diheme cytochrome c family protein